MKHNYLTKKRITVNNKKKIIYFGLKGGQYYIKNNKKYYIKNKIKFIKGGSQQPISRAPSVSLSPLQIYKIEDKQINDMKELFQLYETFLNDMNPVEKKWFQNQYRVNKLKYEEEIKNQLTEKIVDIDNNTVTIYRKNGKIIFIQLRKFNKDKLLVGCGNNPKLHNFKYELIIDKWKIFNAAKNKSIFQSNEYIEKDKSFNDIIELAKKYPQIKNITENYFIQLAIMLENYDYREYLHYKISHHDNYITIDGQIFANPTIIGLFSKDHILPLTYKLNEIMFESIHFEDDIIEKNKILLNDESQDEIYSSSMSDNYKKKEKYKKN